MLASQGWPISVLDDQGSIEAMPRSLHAQSQHEGAHPRNPATLNNNTSIWGEAMQQLGKVPGTEQSSNPGSEAATRAIIHRYAKPSDGPTTVRLNKICIRRFVNVFLSFYRFLHLWEVKEDVSAVLDSSSSSMNSEHSSGEGFDCGIRIHHIVAASDDFSRLSMHWDLMPAAKLNYVHDFKGYFNCISQVVYFHDPDYERRAQERKRVADVSRGMTEPADHDVGGRATEHPQTNAQEKITPVQIIPPLMQLYPDIEVHHADDAGPSLFQRAGAEAKYAWLFAGRTLYLVAPSLRGSVQGVPSPESARILYASNHVAPLLSLYLKERVQQ